MSDIREAFEKWIESRTGGHFAIEDYNDYSLDFACEAWQAALQSAQGEHPAPVAVPEGWKLVPVDPTDEMLRKSNWSGNGDVSVNEEWARRTVWGRMLAAAPQPDHSPDGTVTDYGTKSAPAADGGEVEPADDSSTVYRIGDLGNQIRNLGCLQKHNEEMANSLAELAHQAWVLQRDVMRELTATHPTQPRNEVHKLGQELYEAARCLGCAQSDGNPDATEYWSEKSEAILSRLRSNGGGA